MLLETFDFLAPILTFYNFVFSQCDMMSVTYYSRVVSFYLLLCTALWAPCGKALYKNVFIIIIIIYVTRDNVAKQEMSCMQQAALNVTR